MIYEQLAIDNFLSLDSFFDEPAMLTDMFTAWSDSAFVLVVMSTGMSCDHLAVHMIFFDLDFNTQGVTHR